MNENDLNMKIGELPQSASHSPPQDDKQKELEKNRKKRKNGLVIQPDIGWLGPKVVR